MNKKEQAEAVDAIFKAAASLPEQTGPRYILFGEEKYNTHFKEITGLTWKEFLEFKHKQDD